mmetsp:Transcript_3268/g.3614  ORF Transcript_3268/g.3614 Transcript_3268/m.3614 type:complete len:139 (+) Transcript_3268:734-1150(+)
MEVIKSSEDITNEDSKFKETKELLFRIVICIHTHLQMYNPDDPEDPTNATECMMVISETMQLLHHIVLVMGKSGPEVFHIAEIKPHLTSSLVRIRMGYPKPVYYLQRLAAVMLSWTMGSSTVGDSLQFTPSESLKHST